MLIHVNNAAYASCIVVGPVAWALSVIVTVVPVKSTVVPVIATVVPLNVKFGALIEPVVPVIE